MKTLWYAISHKGEVGSYQTEGEWTDFPRGVLMAYGDCCLTTGLKNEEAAKKALTEFPCDRIQAASK